MAFCSLETGSTHIHLPLRQKNLAPVPIKNVSPYVRFKISTVGSCNNDVLSQQQPHCYGEIYCSWETRLIIPLQERRSAPNLIFAARFSGREILKYEMPSLGSSRCVAILKRLRYKVVTRPKQRGGTEAHCVLYDTV